MILNVVSELFWLAGSRPGLNGVSLVAGSNEAGG